MLMEHEWISRMNMTDWEEVMKASKDYLFVIDQIEEGDHFSGTIIKKISANNYKLNTKISYKESSITAPKCDVLVHCVHKDNVIGPTDSTFEINITRKVESSSIRSVIFANKEWFNHYDNFVRMRVIEKEDELNYSQDLIRALDYVDFMFVSNNYKNLSRVSRCKAAAEKYSIDWVIVKNANLRRTMIKRWTKEFWNAT